jgi:hypothetical protein
LILTANGNTVYRARIVAKLLEAAVLVQRLLCLYES